MSRRCSSAPPTGSTISPARCRRAEEGREATVAASATLVERLAALAEAMRGQQTLLARMGEQSIELRSAINRLSERGSSDNDREALAPTSAPSRTISAGWSRRTRAAGRPSATNCGGMVDRLSERSSDEEREALLAHQRAIEGHLARLVDENVRSRTALADELRGEFRLLARTVASTARGAVHPPGDG